MVDIAMAMAMVLVMIIIMVMMAGGHQTMRCQRRLTRQQLEDLIKATDTALKLPMNAIDVKGSG